MKNYSTTIFHSCISLSCRSNISHTCRHFGKGKVNVNLDSALSRGTHL